MNVRHIRMDIDMNIFPIGISLLTAKLLLLSFIVTFALGARYGFKHPDLQKTEDKNIAWFVFGMLAATVWFLSIILLAGTFIVAAFLLS